MTSTQWALLALLIVCGFWMLGAHNRIIGLRATITEAWMQTDTLLEQRAQVLMALAQVLWEQWPSGRGSIEALRFAQQQLQVAAQALRAKPSRAVCAASLATAEAALNATVARVLNEVESDPVLHAHDQVATQMLALFEFSPKLLEARQRFNRATSTYNEAIEQFPTRLLVPVFRFEMAGAL